MRKVKLLSLFLSLVLVLTSFSGFGVYAVGDTSETAQPVEAERVREIENLREVNSQTYLLSDGKYQCVVYAEDKFYEDSRGKLVEIDNTVTSAKHTRGSVEYAFKNKAGKSDVYFSDATGNIFINAEKGALTFAPKATRSTAKTVLGTKYSLKAADFVISGDDVIAYTDVYPNTDIVYQVTNSGIKEYTVLKAKPETNAISYVFEHEGLSVSQGKKTVSFKNAKGDEAFSLGTLFALDNAGNYTENISYKVTAVDKDTTEITVTLDESYIENASFPIVIDPTVMITGQTNTYDTFVSSANPNTNYYMNTYVRTGYDTPFGKRHTYIKFNLPDSLDRATIDTARINIRVHSGIAPTRVFVYPAYYSWTASTLKWNNRPGYSTWYSTSLSLYQNNWYRAAYVKTIVQEWVNGEKENYGFVLRDADETANDPSKWTTFYSSDAASPNKPELVVEYTPYENPPSDPDDSYTVIWNNYYDFGYPIYYGQSISGATSSITAYTTAVKNRFLELFPALNITVTSPQYYLSPMDYCKEIAFGVSTVEDVVGHCNCPPGQRDNCEWRDSLRNDFMQNAPAIPICSNILWTCNRVYSYVKNHENCEIPDANDENETGYKTDTNRSSSNISYRTVLILNRIDTNRDADSKSVLFHEICHQYSAPDHYHDGDSVDENLRCKNYNNGCVECNDDPRDESCVMNDAWGNDISSDSILCEDCYCDILAWLVVNANDNIYA